MQTTLNVGSWDTKICYNFTTPYFNIQMKEFLVIEWGSYYDIIYQEHDLNSSSAYINKKGDKIRNLKTPS